MSDPNEVDDNFLFRMETIEPFLNCHPIPMEHLIKQAKKVGRSTRTIQRWIKIYRENGPEGLHEKINNDRNSPHNEWKDFIRKNYLSPKRPSAADIHSLCAQTAHQQSKRPPSYATVRRIISIIPKSVSSYHRNRREYLDNFQVIGKLYQAKYPGELFLIDHRELDVMIVKNSNGKAYRPYITTVMDQYSRALVGYYLGFEPPSSRRVALALRHAILPKNDPDWPMCGIPTLLKHDHGQDLMSKHIQQVRLDLGINLLPKEKGNPRANAEIERSFLNMASFERGLPGWTGSSTRNRPKKILPSLNLDKLNTLFRIFVRKYHYRKHSITGMPPIDRWNTGLLPRLPESEAELDLLLLPVARPYKIRRDGVHFQTNIYWCDEFLSFIGETVTLRFDPQRLDNLAVFIGNKRIGTAFCVSGERITYHVCKKRRAEQADRMKSQLPETGKKGALGLNKSKLGSTSDKNHSNKENGNENDLLSLYKNNLQDRNKNNHEGKIVLFNISLEDEDWC